MENIFEVIRKDELNNYDQRLCGNGGGYYQPKYTFMFNNIEGVFEDTSCGDFGGRYFMEWNGYRAAYDQIYGNEGYSDFSCTSEIHRELLVEIYKITGWRVPFKEEYEMEKRQQISRIFNNASFMIDLCNPVKGEVLLKYKDEINRLMRKANYIYWLSDGIKLNPSFYYQLWFDSYRNRHYGFRRVDVIV